MSRLPAWVNRKMTYTPLEANMERPKALGFHDALMEEYLSYLKRCFFITANKAMLQEIEKLRTALILNNQKSYLDSEKTIAKDVVGETNASAD